MANTSIVVQSDFTQAVELVTNSLTSDNSRVMYKRALLDFLTWWGAQGRPLLNKAVVQSYKTQLQGSGLSAASINQKLSAIRKLATEAADNDLIDSTLAAGIAKVQGVKAAGLRRGNWLTKDQAQALINSPDATTLKGIRDRAILSLLVGAGLRRSEAASLQLSDIQQRDSRWVIADLIGKGGRVRTVPIPTFAKTAIDAWLAAADITGGHVFRAINRGGHIAGDTMTDQGIADVVKQYTRGSIAAHDLRRTFAKLAHKGGSPLEQIQLSLGHSSIKTTERYLGVDQDLQNAPCDLLGLRIDWD